MSDDQVQDMQRVASEVQRMASEATAEVVSENGEVRVVAGPGGQIQELDLRYSAYEMSGVELGELIVATLHGAAEKLEAELTAEITRLMGAAMPADDEGGRL